MTTRKRSRANVRRRELQRLEIRGDMIGDREICLVTQGPFRSGHPAPGGGEGEKRHRGWSGNEGKEKGEC